MRLLIENVAAGTGRTVAQGGVAHGGESLEIGAIGACVAEEETRGSQRCALVGDRRGRP